MPNLIDISGQRFGRWTALRRIPPAKPGGCKWVCQCDCGAEREVYLSHLRRGASRSCGCFAVEAHTRHGEANTVLYRRHKAMLARCYNPNHKQFHDYGGRGIGVCDEWRDYENFSRWSRSSGYRRELELDRIDNDADYSPDNCRWVTHRQNMNNMRTTKWLRIGGERITISNAARRYGIKKNTIRTRLRAGWTDEEAVTVPIRTRN